MSVQGRLSPDELALERTAMAADRTLMAWTRTALTLISFGFTIYKFLEYARESGPVPHLQVSGPRRLGMALIGTGVLFLLLASLEYFRQLRRLRPGRRFEWRLPLFLAFALALIGLLALANVVFRFGPF